MEQKFIQNFFRTQKQEWALKNNNSLLIYASSIAMVITANYVMKKKMTVSLLHPCFDNLPDIFKHMQVPLEPLEEEWLHDPLMIYQNLSENVKGDALFIVDPNNPTGFTLFKDKKYWEEVVRYVKDHNKLLLVDFCFASFMLPDKDLDVFDVYELFETSGISYIAYEDTGKTWPLQDTKAAIIKTSKDVYDDVYNIHTSYLLNVSPFILNVLNEFIIDSEKDNFASVFDLLERNREIGQKILAGSLLEPLEPICKVSVLWCRITDPTIKATELKTYLEAQRIHILSGTYFFWHDRQKGEEFVRIALARDPQAFTEAITKLREALDAYKK